MPSSTGPQTLEAYLFADPDSEAVKVLVRGYHDDPGVRLVVDHSGALEEELLIHRNAVGRLADDPQEPITPPAQ